MKALVTGGTGFVGQHLVKCLDNPAILGRSPEKIRTRFGSRVEPYAWEPGKLITADAFRGVDTVFHLAGESIYGRWNQDKKNRILASRVEGTGTMVETLARLEERPQTLICSSAVGYYGSRGNEILTESSGSGTDFLSQVCRAWEKEALKAEELGIRVVCIRTGVVLGKDGGAIPKMLCPFKAGLGGKLGSGRQYMSWIHIDDLIGIMMSAANNKSLRGPVNGVAPQPVTNKEFSKTLAKALHRPALFTVPSLFLRLALGELGSVLLSSQRALPKRIEEAGYEFKYPFLKDAVRAVL